MSTVRRELLDMHYRAAEANRRRANALLRRVETAMGELRQTAPLPLDLLGRYERAVMDAHVDNQLRVLTYTEDELTRRET